MRMSKDLKIASVYFMPLAGIDKQNVLKNLKQLIEKLVEIVLKSLIALKSQSLFRLIYKIIQNRIYN